MKFVKQRVVAFQCYVMFDQLSMLSFSFLRLLAVSSFICVLLNTDTIMVNCIEMFYIALINELLIDSLTDWLLIKWLTLYVVIVRSAVSRRRCWQRIEQASVGSFYRRETKRTCTRFLQMSRSAVAITFNNDIISLCPGRWINTYDVIDSSYLETM